MAGLVDGGSAPIDMSAEEAELRRELEGEKKQYKSKITGLKSFKKEIEHLQHLLEMAKVKLHRDFESWTRDQAHHAAANVSASAPTHAYSGSGGYPNQDEQRVQKAWGTPPLSPIGKGATAGVHSAAAAAAAGSSSSIASAGSYGSGYPSQYQAAAPAVAPSAGSPYGGGGGGSGVSDHERYAAAVPPPVEQAAYSHKQQSHLPPDGGGDGGGGGGAAPVDDDIAAFFAARDAMRHR